MANNPAIGLQLMCMALGKLSVFAQEQIQPNN